MSNINWKLELTRLAQIFYLLLCLIHPLTFSFRLSFPHLLFVIPAQAGIQSFCLDPASSAGWREGWILHQVRDDGKGWIPNPKRFAFGWGWHRWLSVEDDKGAFGWGWQGDRMKFCVSHVNSKIYSLIIASSVSSIFTSSIANIWTRTIFSG